MSGPTATRPRRLLWTILFFFLALGGVIISLRNMSPADSMQLTNEQLMIRLFGIPALFSGAVLLILSACAAVPGAPASATVPADNLAKESARPFIAQVVGVQWLNPLQRMDYPTEWQLLWTLGLVRPNKNDDMVRTDPDSFSTLKSVASIAINMGDETFVGYHEKYIDELMSNLHDIYYMDSEYFYNAHNRDRRGWRELAGIHIEYALPAKKLDQVQAETLTRYKVTDNFDIGNPHFPTLWSHATPPDVHVTMGGNNAGFTSLAAGLDYLKAHPDETVWVMNWDAPSFPKHAAINENLVLLVLAGPNFKTERDALAWIGYPAVQNAGDFAPANKGDAPRTVQAWKAAIDKAANNANKQDTDIGYVIHDANNTQANSSDRLGTLAQTLTTELPEFDFMKQTFNTPALLGEMGAGTALTNVALAIGYANHFGKNVLVAGTSDAEHPTAVVVAPPEKPRPINPDENWFRARGGNATYLFWWGLRHDAQPHSQGYSR